MIKIQHGLPAQAGISLVVVVFVMTIMLSSVLGLGSIIITENKSAKSIGDSIVAFYKADSGVEQLLYYNRKSKPANPPEIISGICDICNQCVNCFTECQVKDNSDNGCFNCQNCSIHYKSANGYESSTIIYPNGNYYTMDISMKGFYNNTSRAVGLRISNKDFSSLSPSISEYSAKNNEGNIDFTAKITAKNSELIDPATVKVHIRNSTKATDPDVDSINLLSIKDNPDYYLGTWIPYDNGYLFYISVCDQNQHCAQSAIFQTSN